jgi:hypothetical protein
MSHIGDSEMDEIRVNKMEERGREDEMVLHSNNDNQREKNEDRSNENPTKKNISSFSFCRSLLN